MKTTKIKDIEHGNYLIKDIENGEYLQAFINKKKFPGKTIIEINTLTGVNLSINVIEEDEDFTYISKSESNITGKPIAITKTEHGQVIISLTDDGILEVDWLEKYIKLNG